MRGCIDATLTTPHLDTRQIRGSSVSLGYYAAYVNS